MLKKCLRTLCMLLVITLLMNMLPMSIFAQEFQEHLSATEQAEFVKPEESAEEAYIVKEITENRTEFSKEFQLSNGLRMAAVYADAVHYETDNGWEEIDNTLTAHTDGTYATTAGVWQVRFPDQLTKAKGITLQKDGYTLSFYMAGELKSNHELMTIPQTQEMLTAEAEAMLPKTFAVEEISMSAASIQPVDTEEMKASVQYPQIVPEKASSRLLYENIYENTDLIYDLNGNQVKESIVLSKYDSALRGYQYTLETGTMHPVLNEDGSIYFYDADQENIVMVMPAPYLVDDAQDYCDDITVSLTGQDGIYTLSYQLPLQWLAAQDRAWPVVLDPAVMPALTTSNIRDRTVASQKTYAQNWGMNSCGYGTGVGISRFYLKYNALPSITSSDVIVAAFISMISTTDSTGKQMVVEAHKVNAPWASETITWANKPGYNTNVEDYTIVDSLDGHTWNITDIARDWYATSNNGVMFKMPDSIESSTTDNYKQFVSSDYTENDAYQPILTIYFRNNNGLESYWDYTASSAGRAGTGYVNNFTGNLVFVREDMGFGGNRMPVSISHVYNANDAITPSDDTNSNDSGGNSFGLGVGWRTNFNQLVYRWEINDVDKGYYIWEDSDGTDHYFEYDTELGKYSDESNSELTLTDSGNGTEKYCIEDKNGNCSYFDTNGRLTKKTNNQQTKSSITITYDGTSNRISIIEDGVGRKYYFSYPSGLLSRISYKGTGSNEISYISFSYSGSHLTGVTNADGETSIYGYSNNLLSTAKDIDGYTLTYTYNTPSQTWQPYRVQSVSESDGAAQGGSLSISYAHNQTTFTDHNGNVEIHQFNDYGNTVCIQDDEGHAQYTQFALNTDKETENNTDATKKTNQLRLSSKLQNTVGNRLKNNSFEDVVIWSSNSASLTLSQSAEAAYIGGKSMKMVSAVDGAVAAYTSGFSVNPNESYTFSAYVKTESAHAMIALQNTANYSIYIGSRLDPNHDWTRLQVTYTNTTNAAVTITPILFLTTAGTAYVDNVQAEKAVSPSRYNLLDNGDFRHGSYGWTGYGMTSADATIGIYSDLPPAGQLDNSVYRITGNPQGYKQLVAFVGSSGGAGDSYVISGWAKGNSVPIFESKENQREFKIVVALHNYDGTKTYGEATFNPDSNQWQYSAAAVVAEKDYHSMAVVIRYNFNANTVFFDGIQLYKEEFGSSYTYDDEGNVISVTDLQKQTTTYEYANNDLTKIIENGNTKMSYDYDDYHNVETATTQENLVYNFTYDAYGNNTTVSITKDGSTMSSSATYSTDGNRLESTTDALGNETLYRYNKDTNVLDWVQYPNDTDGSEDPDDPKDTRTNYTYDSMYRMASAACTTDKGNNLSAEYTYGNNTQADLLTAIQTPSTTYHFTYGDFGLRTSVSAGTATLATYEYTDDANRYLSKLDYGNDGSVQYTYDNKGRLLTQTYEDGDKVTCTYDNNGALATMVDHATGITTTYYYDLSDRMAKYTESGAGYSHSVEYTYDVKNNLQKLEETINGVDHTTDYSYDDDNRITSVKDGNTGVSYDYDDFGRLTERTITHSESPRITDTYTYTATEEGNITPQVAGILHFINGTAKIPLESQYEYDGNGNITRYTYGPLEFEYTYDTANQLLSEENSAANKRWEWSYDDSGNILSRKTYNLSTGALLETDTYSYGHESNWGDLLTSYEGYNVEYDAIGNLLDDGNWLYTWEHGRQLARMADVAAGGTQWEFSYNTDGMRTQRTDGTNTYTYVYSGSLLKQMTKGNDTLYFTYDASGVPVSVTHNNGTTTATYYYLTNLQGDVLHIFNSNGDVAGNYTYDAWGNPVSTGTSAICQLNPLRYRGYVYDRETGLYYLQSRYYNPNTGRFINADAFAATGQGFVGNNMFAYCGNNPVCRKDVAGTSWIGALVILGVTLVCSFLFSSCTYTQEDHNAQLAGAPDLDTEIAPNESYNCYGNAIGKQIEISPFGVSQGDSAETVFAAVQGDLGESNVTRLNSINDTIGADEYMVALRCGPQDYHFIRKDENGWFNKVGLDPGYYIDESIFTKDIWRFGYIEEGFGYLEHTTYYEGEIIYFAVKVGWDSQ